jgi:hypothetical protein
MPEIHSDPGHPRFSTRLAERSQSASLWPLGHFEPDGLPFLQAAETACLNRGVVHEDIASTLAANEAVVFGVVKPLYCSLFR